MAVLDISNWYVSWCEPIVVALYSRDPQEIRTKLAAAGSILAEGKLKALEADCLSYQLTYLEFQAQLVLQDRGWDDTHLINFIARLSQPSEYLAADRLRRRLLLQLRINMDRLDLIELTPLDFEELFHELPEEEYTTEAWLYISGWAFRHEQPLYLEKAYEFALLQARGFEVDWTWQRVHLMWKLARGDATREDLLWLIDKADIHKHLRSIQRGIWQKARDLGIVDERIELRLHERELELQEQSTKRLARHLTPHLANPSTPSVAQRT
jgi:hypothetical protein